MDESLFSTSDAKLVFSEVLVSTSETEDFSTISLEGEASEYGLIIQGDILLPYSKQIKTPGNLFGGSLPQTSSFADNQLSIDQVGKLWPGGVIPFSCSTAVEDLVLEAAAIWQNLTPIQFVEVDFAAHISWAEFHRTPRKQSYSPIGCHLGANPVGLSENATLATAIHEIGHLLRLWHEHARHDRENYVEFLSENTEPNFYSQFAPIIGLPDPPVSYDIQSIMHYPDNMFARAPGLKTLLPLHADEILVNEDISALDVEKVVKLYTGTSPALYS